MSQKEMKKIVLIAAICVILPFMYVGKVTIKCKNNDSGTTICNDTSGCSWRCFESDDASCHKMADGEHMNCVHNPFEKNNSAFCKTNNECGFNNATLFKGLNVSCTIKRDDSPDNTDNQHTTKAPTDQGPASSGSNSQNATSRSGDKTFTLDAKSCGIGFAIGFVICFCLGASAWAIHFCCCKKRKPNSAPDGGRIWNRVPLNPPVRTEEGGASSSSPGECEAESTSPVASTSAV